MIISNISPKPKVCFFENFEVIIAVPQDNSIKSKPTIESFKFDVYTKL